MTFNENNQVKKFLKPQNVTQHHFIPVGSLQQADLLRARDQLVGWQLDDWAANRSFTLLIAMFDNRFIISNRILNKNLKTVARSSFFQLTICWVVFWIFGVLDVMNCD